MINIMLADEETGIQAGLASLRAKIGSPIATQKIDLFVYSSPERKQLIRQYAGTLILSFVPLSSIAAIV